MTVTFLFTFCPFLALLLMNPYQLVSCDFHDELESLATLHEPCEIVYKTDSGETTTVNSRIADVYASNHADFVKLEDGTEIRLDCLVSVNGKQVSFVNAEAQ